MPLKAIFKNVLLNTFKIFGDDWVMKVFKYNNNAVFAGIGNI